MISVMVTPSHSSTSTTSPRATRRLLTRMSMASPTFRSSSRMAPGASLRRSPIGMRELPSTAETMTGTSNTCSRSDAPFVMTGPSFVEVGATWPEPKATSVSSSWGRGRSVVAFAMFVLAVRSAPRRGAHEGFVHRRLDTRLLAHDAAVRPFDAPVAGRDLGLAHHHEASLVAALAGYALH